MRYLIILLAFLTISSGSYNYSSYRVKSVLAVTEQGDTIAVPIREFERQKYDTYTRFNWNNQWYWNNWRYNYDWRFNNWWWNSLYWNNNNIIVPRRVYPGPQTQQNPRLRPRINQPRPEPRPRPGINSPLPPKPPRTKDGNRPMISRPNIGSNPRVRTTPNVQTRPSVTPTRS